MVDITKDEIWDVKEENILGQVKKKVSIKRFILEHKMLSAGLIIFMVCVLANVALIYSFFRMIKIL